MFYYVIMMKNNFLQKYIFLFRLNKNKLIYLHKIIKNVSK